GSRDQLLLLRLSNVGGSPAYDLQIDWNDPPLQTHQGNVAHFADTQPEVRILLPSESLALAVGVPAQFFKTVEAEVFAGTLSYRDGAGRSHRSKILLSAEHYRRALQYDREELATHKRLQELPKKLDDLAAAIRSLQPPE